MADDMIDIEEHDVMENPMIRQIFPDLSILKKEIIDYNDDIQEELLNSETYHSNGPDNLIFRNLNKSNLDKPLNTKTIYSNKIILASKKNKNITPKVYVKNVRLELLRSKKFCETCLILFSTKQALYNHQMLHHNTKDYGKTSCQQIFSVNNSFKKHREIPYSNDVNFKCYKNNSVNSTNEVECTSQNKISDINIMVKINESHIKSVDNNFVKPCFHCSVVFPSRQSLIDHLYEILNNKKLNFQSLENRNNKDVVFDENDEILQDTSIHEQSMNNTYAKADYRQNDRLYYSCPICSYYFELETSYKKHMLGKHNISNKINIERVEFCSKCKICHLNFNDVLLYNNHLSKRHRNQMKKTITDNFFRFNNQDLLRQSKFTYKKSATLQINALERNTKLVPENSKSDEGKRRLKEVRIMALKAILFKCVECNIHFLTSEAASNHVVHSESLHHWKCTNCRKLFKQEQQRLHEKQHKYSKYFTVVEVTNDSRVLYECPICTGNFKKENLSDHRCNCLSELETYSTVCDGLIDHDQEESIQETRSIPDCTIIVDEKSDITTKLNHIDQNSDMVTLMEKRTTVVDEKSDIPTKLNENSDMVTLMKKPTTIVDEKSDTTTKLNYINQNSDMVTLMKKRRHIYYFCNICKCNIPKACNMEEHLQSSCTRFTRNVCEFCGLVFSNTTISSHKRLHQKYKHLKLQDFKFFDLKTKIKRRPISDFPKCRSCEKHFINEYEVVNHLCEEGSCIKCLVCKIKFTDSAFKLHEPFHSYKLKIQSKSKIHQFNIDSIAAEATKEDQNLLSPFCSKTRCMDEVLYIYTCKNCSISMNIYYDVVEHCHSHTNLNKIEIDVIECTICNVNFIPSSYDRHQQLHLIHSKENFKYLYFDVLYFSVSNDEWLNHVFRTLPKDAINKVIEKSIYKYENKIKMEIIQHGSQELTIYKCDKCQLFVDGESIYEHIVNCSNDCVKFYCKMCNIPFISNTSRNEHEKIHLNLKIALKSCRIVIFNREQDKIINQNVSKPKYYVLFECRYCHVTVNKNSYKNHECNSFNCKSCNMCGLLMHERDYDVHILKHKIIDSFNKNNMKVVLIGNKTVNEIKVKTNDLISTFSGMVCDYTFYKCLYCEVCIKEFRNTNQHYCLIDAAKSKCPQCDLIFDEGKIKGHLKLHDTDPEFTKDTIIVKTFNSNPLKKKEYSKSENIYNKSNKNDDHKNEVMLHDSGVGVHVNNISNKLCIPEVIVRIYKCYCGLHFISETQIKEHFNKCSGIVKINQSRHDCFKCGLTFTSNVLFKHLLEHHGSKNTIFKYEIIENFNNVADYSL